MASFKLIFVAVLAIFIVGCDARDEKRDNIVDAVKNLPQYIVNLVSSLGEGSVNTVKSFEAFVHAIKKIMKKGWDLFQTELRNIKHCSTLPREENRVCINTEVDKSLLGIAEIATDIVFLAANFIQIFKPLIRELTLKPLGSLFSVLGNGEPLIDKLYQMLSKF